MHGAIVLSAFAVDCRLGQVCLLRMRLKKLSSIKNQKERFWPSLDAALDDEVLEKELRDLGSSFVSRFRELESLICPEGLSDFIKSEPELYHVLTNGFPSLGLNSLLEDVQKSIFWPRNHIIHLGLRNYSSEQATLIFNQARFIIDIIDRLNTRAEKNLNFG